VLRVITTALIGLALFIRLAARRRFPGDEVVEDAQVETLKQAPTSHDRPKAKRAKISPVNHLACSKVCSRPVTVCSSLALRSERPLPARAFDWRRADHRKHARSTSGMTARQSASQQHRTCSRG
jgi:hypothetical protein